MRFVTIDVVDFVPWRLIKANFDIVVFGHMHIVCVNGPMRLVRSEDPACDVFLRCPQLIFTLPHHSDVLPSRLHFLSTPSEVFSYLVHAQEVLLSDWTAFRCNNVPGWRLLAAWQFYFVIYDCDTWFLLILAQTCDLCLVCGFCQWLQLVAGMQTRCWCYTLFFMPWYIRPCVSCGECVVWTGLCICIYGGKISHQHLCLFLILWLF